MIVKLAKSGIYTPNWDNNRKLPEAEQIQVDFDYLTPAQRDECFRDVDPKTLADTDRGEIAMRRVYNATVKRFRRLKVQITDGEVTELSDPQSVVNTAGFYELYVEVALEMAKTSAVHDLKNSKPPTSSSAKDTAPTGDQGRTTIPVDV